jgi:hypothetical protein
MTQDKDTFLARIPPQVLAELNARALAEGRPLKQVAEDHLWALFYAKAKARNISHEELFIEIMEKYLGTEGGAK